jgi:hypothetical protein
MKYNFKRWRGLADVVKKGFSTLGVSGAPPVDGDRAARASARRPRRLTARIVVGTQPF